MDGALQWRSGTPSVFESAGTPGPWTLQYSKDAVQARDPHQVESALDASGSKDRAGMLAEREHETATAPDCETPEAPEEETLVGALVQRFTR